MYPISSTTYLLIPKDLTNLGTSKAQTLVDLIYWALTTGQGSVQSLNYSPLPSDIQQQALQLLDQVRMNGKVVQPSPAVKS